MSHLPKTSKRIYIVDLTIRLSQIRKKVEIIKKMKRIVRSV